MGKTKYFIFIVFSILLFFLNLQKTQAAEVPSQEVVINEVMWMGSANWRDEWIELYNTTDQTIDLSNWQIKYWSGTSKIDIPAGKFIYPKDFFLISHYDLGDSNTILNIKPDLVYPSITLSDTNLQIKLFDSGENLIDIAGDGGAPFWGEKTDIKKSMERNEIPGDGTLTENWHTAIDSIGFITGVTEKGTPRSMNSIVIDLYPTVPVLRFPENEKNLLTGQEVEFSWLQSIDPEGQDITYDFYLSCSIEFTDNKLVDSAILETSYFLEINNIIEDYGSCSRYYWQIIASDGSLETPSEIYSFTISEPVYSNAIIINELYPDPGAGEEWVELFNNSAESVNLKNWILEDLKGSIHQYKISDDLIVPNFGYLVIYKSQSGITLNNDEDGVRLIRPDNIVLSETPIFSGGQKGWTFAHDSGGVWQWTTTPTPEKINVMTAVAAEEENNDTTEEENIPINTAPVEVKTGEIQNYENYLVKITGTVVETSGNTFYLDDGSGKAKVYIQESTGIDKPPMHRGDIFEIMGIVDLFRGVWRVLPQKKEDIKLIRAISAQKDEETKSSTAKATSSKSSTAKKSTAATTKARSPTTQKVAGADSQDAQTKIQSYRSSFWVQMTKAVSGLAIILLILLIVKIVQIKREIPFINKPLGGDFGDDT